MRRYEPLLPLAGEGILATLNEDGTPLQTRAAFFYDGESYYFKTKAGAPELDNLHRDPRLSVWLRNPLEIMNHIVVRGSAVERRVQPSHGLVYVRVAVESESTPIDIHD